MIRNSQREDAEVDEAKRKLVPRLVVAVLALVVGLTGAVSASPGSGATGVVLAQGRMPGRLKIKTREASDVVVQQVTLQPGGFTGWHTHPGVVLAVVKAGTLTRYLADCTSKTYRTGDAFIETAGVHLGRNEDRSVPVELYVTYIDPAGSPLRIEADPPPCAASLGAGAS